MEVRWLSRADVESVGLSSKECIELVRRTLMFQAQGLLEMPPKLGVHPPEGRHMHAMPSFIPAMGALGLKWLGDFPDNRKKGLPTLSAVIVLSDPHTGAPVSVMDGTVITSMRTAAMTAVCMQACARPGVEVAAIIGTGVQARAHAMALPEAIPSLKTIRIVGRESAAAMEFCERVSPLTLATLVPVASRADAVKEAPVVVTLTNAVTTRLLEPEWLIPGVTVLVLDNGGKETGILSFVDRIFVDDSRPFSGEEVCHRFPTGVPRIDGEIGQVLAGKLLGRTNERERILILNLGIAASDIVLATEIHRRALQLGTGTAMMI